MSCGDELKSLTIKTNSIRLVKSLGDSSPPAKRSSGRSKVVLAKLHAQPRDSSKVGANDEEKLQEEKPPVVCQEEKLQEEKPPVVCQEEKQENSIGEQEAESKTPPRRVLIKRDSSKVDDDAASVVSEPEDTPIFNSHVPFRPAGGTAVVKDRDENALATSKSTSKPVRAEPPPMKQQARTMSNKSIKWAPDDQLVVETRAKTQYRVATPPSKWKQRRDTIIAWLKRVDPDDDY